MNKVLEFLKITEVNIYLFIILKLLCFYLILKYPVVNLKQVIRIIMNLNIKMEDLIICVKIRINIHFIDDNNKNMINLNPFLGIFQT